MKFGKSLMVFMTATAGVLAQAQAQPPAIKSAGTAIKAPSPTDLRTLLRRGAHNVGVTPRQLSAEERAALRRQLSQPARRAGKRS